VLTLATVGYRDDTVVAGLATEHGSTGLLMRSPPESPATEADYPTIVFQMVFTFFGIVSAHKALL